MIRTVKGFFHKSDHDEALLAYRATPLGPNRPSPAQLMFNRKIQTNLPAYIRSHEQMRDPTRHENSPIPAKQNDKELPDLHMHQPVFHQDVAKRTWSHGVVAGIGPAPRSYTIRCNDTGRLLCRNRVLLRPRSVTFKEGCPSGTLTATLPDYSPAADLEPPALNTDTPNTETSPPTASTVPTAPPYTQEPPKPRVPNANTSTPKRSVKPPNESSTPPKRRVEPADDAKTQSKTSQVTRYGRHIRKPDRLIESPS